MVSTVTDRLRTSTAGSGLASVSFVALMSNRRRAALLSLFCANTLRLCGGDLNVCDGEASTATSAETIQDNKNICRLRKVVC